MNNKLPITLGISGHRDLRAEDREILRKSVRQIIQFIRQHYPNNPLELLSPLAEGADILVAQVALEEKVRLIAPLPLPLHLYEMDFGNQEIQETFSELLKQAEVIELPLLDSEENLSNYGEARNLQYVQVGAYVAKNSDILIALWDGLPLEKAGGTSQVVKFMLTGDMMDLPKEYQNSETGAVCQIVTPRKSGKALKNVGEIRVLGDKKCKYLSNFDKRSLP